MRKLRVVVASLCVVSLVGLAGCEQIMGLIRANRAAKQWEGEVKEIAFAKLEKDGKVFDIELHSRIDYPIDKVYAAIKQPERLADFSEQYKLSKLLSEEGNKKQLEIHMMALDNLQALTVEIVFDDANKKTSLKTLTSTIADIDATYELKPSPDGTKTMYIYKAKQTDKVALPISVDVQRSAIKESFVNQVRAIKAQIERG
ncbi:MAG: hypothetical protein ACE5E4_06730 [Candidatus Binatia bacterium]